MDIEAQFDAGVEIREITVDNPSIFILDLDFAPRQGSLEIRTEWTKWQVYLDDREVRPIDKTLSGISPGDHGLTVIGVSAEGIPVFWEGVINIRAGKRLVVDIP